MKRLILYSAIIAVFVLPGCFDVRGEESEMNPNVKSCPNSPNCVSSQDPREAHHVESLRYAGSLESARRRLLETLAAFPRVRVVKTEDTYIHAEFRSLIFRFTDDVEFWFPPAEGIIHVRSASRIGYSDFGANRKRVERIRQTFTETAVP
jgi:uncharacterized protein (DUF1499 family)